MTWEPTLPLEKEIAKHVASALERKIERVTKAMYDAECNLDGNIIPWDEQTPLYLTRLRILALAAIQELER